MFSVCLNRLTDLESMKRHRGNSLAPIWPAATYRNSLGRKVCRFTCKVRRERGKLLRPIRGQARGRPRVAGGRSASRNGICPLQTLLPRLFHPKAVQVASTYHPRWGNGTSATATSPRNLIVANWTGVSTSSFVHRTDSHGIFSKTVFEFNYLIIPSLCIFL